MTEKQKKKSTHFPQRKYAVKVRRSDSSGETLAIGLFTCGTILLYSTGLEANCGHRLRFRCWRAGNLQQALSYTWQMAISGLTLIMIISHVYCNLVHQRVFLCDELSEPLANVQERPDRQDQYNRTSTPSILPSISWP